VTEHHQPTEREMSRRLSQGIADDGGCVEQWHIC